MPRRPLKTDRAPANPAYSQGIEVTTPGRIIYTAGYLSVDLSGKVIGEGDFATQARTIFQYLEAVLAEGGASLKDVTKMTGFFTDLRYLPIYNEIRREVFGAEPPASTSVQVAALARPGALLEVEAVAVVPER